MKIKKILASLLAGVIAVTAISTVSISAVTKEQKAETIVYDVSERGWQVEWRPTLTVSGAIANLSGMDAGGEVYTFNHPIEITFSNGTKTETYSIPKNEKLILKPTISTGGEVNIGSFGTLTSIKITAIIKSKEFMKESKAKDAAMTSIKDEYFNDTVKPANSLTITKKEGVTNIFEQKFSTQKFGTNYTGKVSRMENKGRELNFKINKDNNTIYLNKAIPNLGLAIVNAVGDKKGAKIKFTFTPDTIYDSIDKDTFGPTLDYNEIAGSMKDLAIAPARGDSFSGKTQGAAEIVNNTATFDWDSIVAGSGLSINSIGLVNDIVMGSAKERTLILEKVEIIIPAKTFDDLSAGEGQTETEEVITSAADEVETDATEPVDNPTTGNAPIALAAIPVAIGAAAILAKKRK